MMAKIEDVFQIIRERNFKNGTDNRYDNKKSDHRSNDIKKKSRSNNKEKYHKVEKKIDKRSRSRSPKRRLNDRFHRDRGDKVQRDGNKYHKNDRHSNKFTRGGRRNQSRDKEYSNKKKKDKRRSSSSSGDRKNKKKYKNGNEFSLSPEVKD